MCSHFMSNSMYINCFSIYPVSRGCMARAKFYIAAATLQLYLGSLALRLIGAFLEVLH